MTTQDSINSPVSARFPTIAVGVSVAATLIVLGVTIRWWRVTALHGAAS